MRPTTPAHATLRLLSSVVATVALAVLAVLSLGVSAALAAPAEPAADVCAEQVSPSWDQVADVDGVVTVGEAILRLPGCPDGEVVGFQLQLGDDLAPDELLTVVVQDETARFDLTPFAVPVAPVTGVRVVLVDRAATIAIDLERRYVNPAGNEQVGLATIDRLELAPGATYDAVAGRASYAAVACASFGITATTPPVVAEGADGPFTATTPGTHLACFQLQAGPADDDTEVLGEVLERGDGANVGVGRRGGGTEVLSAVLERLPATGGSIAQVATLAGILVGAGTAALSWRRRDRRTPDA